MSHQQEIILYDPPARQVEHSGGSRSGNDESNARNIDLAVAAWLHIKKNASGSQKTLAAYSSIIKEFRAVLHHSGLDLDADSVQIALMAQAYVSGLDAEGKSPAAATVNQKTAVLSSFYRYCLKVGLLSPAVASNPIERVERRKVDQYRGAVSLEPDAVREQLAAIDRGELAGLRDYALLMVGLTTGRRLSELAGLKLRHLTNKGGGKIEVFFERCKGGKQMRDMLAAHVGQALLDYLKVAYPTGATAGPDSPVWVSLSSNGTHGRALSKQTISQICERRLGTTKVHTLRHTFAHTMEASGAKVSDIQAKLGHRSLATTGIYLAALKRAENEHADELARLFGG